MKNVGDMNVYKNHKNQSYTTSEYIDSHLKPIANRHERFVKNTDDLLSKLPKD